MSNPVPLTELLEHAGWIQRLARALSTDEAAANDLVQDTWLRLLIRPPKTGGSLRGWLAKVVTNLARQRRRSEVVRRAARPTSDTPPAPSSADLLERAETHRILVEEVMRLHGPTRQAVLMRYFEDLPIRDIARIQGVAEGTVRSQLTRARAELRTRINRRFGPGAERILSALALPLANSLPIAPTTTAAPTPEVALQTTALVMQSHKLLGVVAITLVLGAGLVALMVTSGPWSDTTTLTEPPARDLAPIEQAQAEPAIPVDAAVANPRRETVAPTPDQPTSDGIPVTTVTASLVNAGGWPVTNGQLESRDVELELGVAEAAGDVHAKVDPELFDDGVQVRQVRWKLTAPGFASTFLTANLQRARHNHLGVIRMQPACVIAGRVVDADGSPIEGAEVHVTEASTGTSYPETSRLRGVTGDLRVNTDHLGRFSFADVAPGTRRVWAGRDGQPWAASDTLRLAPHDRIDDVELTLEELAAEEIVRGVVVGPRGLPVAEAEVKWTVRRPYSTNNHSTTADQRGRFVLPVHTDATLDLRASDPTGQHPDAIANDVTPSAEWIELRLGSAAELSLLVLAPGGDPLPRYAFTVREPGAGPGAFGRYFTEVEYGTHRDGLARFIPPEGSFEIEIEARHFARSTVGPLDASTWGERQTVTLAPLPGLRGTVHRAGKGVAGAVVELFAAVEAHRHVEYSGFDVRVYPRALDETVTEADGTFHLNVHDDGAYYVRAEHGSLAPTERGPIEIDTETGATADLELVEGGTLEGFVRVAPGRSPEGVIVGCSRGDAHGITVRSGEGGFFRIENLLPGEWLVTRHRFEVDPTAGPTLISNAETPVEYATNCTIRDGETTHFDIDLTNELPCTLEGRVQIAGIATEHWVVNVWPTWTNIFSGELPTAVLAADGSFDLTVEQPGVYRLTFQSPLEQAAAMSFSLDVELVDGANQWSEHLPTGGVRIEALEGAEPSLEGTWRLTVQGSGDLECERALELHGLPIDIAGLPAGTVTLQRRPADATRSGWQDVARGVLQAGTTLPLVVE